MPRGVNDINLHPVMHDGTILRIDCDAPLPLNGITVHHAVDDFLVLPEHMTLAQERIHQCGLPRIDVGDNSYINDFLKI